MQYILPGLILIIILFFVYFRKNNINTDYHPKSNINLSNKTDRELIEILIKLNINNEKHLSNIDGIMLFFLIISIISILIYFFSSSFLR